MTIDLYPEIIRQQDLSPDQGFGADIDEDCQVRGRNAKPMKDSSIKFKMRATPTASLLLTVSIRLHRRLKKPPRAGVPIPKK
jgi:hypothetical protein